MTKATENHQQLLSQVKQQARRLKKARRERSGLIRQTRYLGALGLMLVLPVVGGAYLGLWLDKLADGYSVRWTLSLILLGVFVGLYNVYYFIKD